MAADGRCRWRRQNFVNLLLLVDGVDCDEEEREVKRERELLLQLAPSSQRRFYVALLSGASKICISSSPQSTADTILFVFKPSPLGLPWAR